MSRCQTCGRLLEHDDEREVEQCESCQAAEFSEGLRDLTEEFE
jgi:hypothetical protein